MRVSFLHPDLGLGGAERLVVDAAVILQESFGHSVKIYTSFYDRKRAFKETWDGTLSVKVWGGSYLPRHIFGSFHVFFAILANILTALFLVFSELFLGNRDEHVLIIDQIPISIPVFKMILPKTKIIFYCHFPDKLLAQRKKTDYLKCIYRIPFDALEGFTMGFADKILVNSEFTRSVFKESFPRITKMPDILYPGINLGSYDVADGNLKIFPVDDDVKFVLSINRFERKKNISLAIRSFLVAKKLYPKLVLVLAGGFDERLEENRSYFKELWDLSISLKLNCFLVSPETALPLDKEGIADVIFIPSFTDEQRFFLLQNATCLLYTPSFEHFGIVPIEAMYSRLPVIAVNSGGPTESVIDGKTGYLVEPQEDSMGEALISILKNLKKSREMGNNARLHVKQKFSLQQFGQSLNSFLMSELENK